jgi:hypothetical protein
VQVSSPVTVSLKGEIMNKLNVASLSASKKLVDNGIVLETDAVWVKWYFDGSTPYNREPYEWRLQYKALTQTDFESIPAPCFTEVWRELPFQSYIKKLDDGSTLVWICDDDIESNMIANTNPTDALIDLLIWLKGEGR